LTAIREATRNMAPAADQTLTRLGVGRRIGRPAQERSCAAISPAPDTVREEDAAPAPAGASEASARTTLASGEREAVRSLDDAAALDWLRQQPGGSTNLSPAALGLAWGWRPQRVGARLKAWRVAGLVKQRGAVVTAVDVAPTDASAAQVGEAVPPAVPPAVLRPLPAHSARSRMGTGERIFAYTSAVSLAGAAAYFSIRGMTVLFPGAPVAVMAMAICMECAKLSTTALLAKQWRALGRLSRAVLAVLVTGLAAINAAGVYSQLDAAHVGEHAAVASTVQVQDASVAAKIEVATGRLADLDKQIAAIDNAVSAATQRGKTNTALAAMDSQKKARAGLAGEREKAAGALAALKTERAQVASHGRQIEAEAAPIVYVAAALGLGGDSEQAIRWLILLMVLCCDPLAIALTAATAAVRAR
jgi:hypothetical protein